MINGYSCARALVMTANWQNIQRKAMKDVQIPAMRVQQLEICIDIIPRLSYRTQGWQVCLLKSYAVRYFLLCPRMGRRQLPNVAHTTILSSVECS